MGRVILVEGLDWPGSPRSFEDSKKDYLAVDGRLESDTVTFAEENPVAKVTRQMMRWDPGFQPTEGAPLFLASHLWDLRNFEPPRRVNGLHLQDSCALRSLAFERILGKDFYAQQLEEVVDRLPVFDAAYVLTASMKNRKERFLKREKNDLHDSFMLSDPVRFARVDSELLRLCVEKCRAKLVCTDEFDAEELLDFVWGDLQKKLGRCHRSVA